MEKLDRFVYYLLRPFHDFGYLRAPVNFGLTSPVPELSFLPAPYRGSTRAGERRVQAPVVQKVDNAIHRINYYPADSVVCFVKTYPLDSDLSSG